MNHMTFFISENLNRISITISQTLKKEKIGKLFFSYLRGLRGHFMSLIDDIQIPV